MKNLKKKTSLASSSTKLFLQRNKKIQSDRNMSYQQQLLNVENSRYKLSESTRAIAKIPRTLDSREENRPMNCFKKKRSNISNIEMISSKNTNNQLTDKNSSRLLHGKFKKIKKIGCGSFSNVFLCQDTKENKFVVIKEMELDTLNCPVKFFNVQVVYFVYYFIINLE